MVVVLVRISSALSIFRSAHRTKKTDMTADGTQYPLWTQDQAIAYEAALEAINDVVAGYSEQIEVERNNPQPSQKRVDWLRLRRRQARSIAHSLDVTDDLSVSQALAEFSAMVRARDAFEAKQDGPHGTVALPESAEIDFEPDRIEIDLKGDVLG